MSNLCLYESADVENYKQTVCSYKVQINNGGNCLKALLEMNVVV